MNVAKNTSYTPTTRAATSQIVDGTSNLGTAYSSQRKIVRTTNGTNSKRTFVVGYTGSALILYYSDDPDAVSPSWTATSTLITTTTHFVADIVWDQTNNVLYIVYGRDTGSDNTGSDIFYRRVSTLGTTPTVGAQQIALDATNSLNYTHPHVEIAGDLSTNKVFVFATQHTDAANASVVKLRTGTLNSDAPTWDTAYDVRTWTASATSSILRVTRLNTNKLIIFYYNGTDLLATRHDDIVDAQSTPGWDALNGTDNSQTTISADDPTSRGMGSAVGDDDSDVIWFTWTDAAADINVIDWNGSTLGTETVAQTHASATLHSTLTTNGTSVYLVYVDGADTTKLVYQRNSITNASYVWNGSVITIEDHTENILQPSVPSKINQSYLDVVYTTQTTQLVRHTGIFLGISISGSVIQTNGSNFYDCSTNNLTVALKINGAGTTTAICTAANGAFSFLDILVVANDVITIYVDGNINYKAISVGKVVSATSNISPITIVQNRLTIGANGGISHTNAASDLGIFDGDDDTDIFYTANSNALIVNSGFSVRVANNSTYTTNGSITTQGIGGDFIISGTATLDSPNNVISGDVSVGGTLYINANISVNGGDIINTSTGTIVSTSGTPTVTLSGTGSVGGGTGTVTFYNLTTSGTGTTTIGSPVTISNDLTVGTGTTINGTNNITVNGGDIAGDGTVNMSGGMVTLTGTGNFGSNTNWSFYNLTFDGVSTSSGSGSITVINTLVINTGKTLNAGSKTWIISGSGTPLINFGTFNSQSSTFTYNSVSNTNIYPLSYNNLVLSPSSGAPIFTPATGSGGLGSTAIINDGGNMATALGNSTRQIVRTSTGVLYTFLNKGSSSCGIWRSTNGTTWTEQDTSNRPDCTASTLNSSSIAIDSADNLHIIYPYANSGEGLKYNTFNTTNNTFGTSEIVVTAVSSSIAGHLSLALDSNNKPHLIYYYETQSGSLEYRNKVGGSWTAAYGITGGSSVSNTGIVVDEDNVPIVVYTDGVTPGIKASIGNQNNPVFFTSYVIDSTISSTSYAASIAVDSSGNTWISYIDSTENTTLAKRPDGNETSQWSTGWSFVTNFNVGNTPTLMANGTDMYVFYEDELDDIVYDKYNGSAWAGENKLLTGTYNNPQLRWSYYNNASHATYGVDFLFSDGTDVLYNNISITSSSPICNNCTLSANSITLAGSGNVTFDVNTTDSIIDVNGNLTISSGDTFSASNSAALTISGNFTNNGTFTHNSGTITFDTTGTSIISGGNTTFHNFTSTTAGKTIKFQKHIANTPTFTINGLLTLTGASGNLLNIESDTAASQWLINHQGTESVNYVSLKDSGCNGSTAITTTDSTNAGNNGTCWENLTGAGITISGFVYSDESSTLWTGAEKCDGSSVVVSISINGGTKQSTTCNATTGAFSFSEVSIDQANRVITIFIDNHAIDKGVIYTKNNDTTTSITGLSLIVDRVILRSESSQSITNANINTYDIGNETDIPIGSDGSNASTISSVKKIVISSGDTYAPGGNVTTNALEVIGTYSGSIETLELRGQGTSATCTDAPNIVQPLCINGGTFTVPSTVNFTSTTDSVSIAAIQYVNLGIGTSDDPSPGRYFTLTGNTTVSSVLTVGNNSSTNQDYLYGGSYSLTFTGSGTPLVITSKGAFVSDTSTVNYIGASATNIAAANYYHLGVGTTADSNSVTYSLSGITIITYRLTLGNAGSTNNDTLNAGNHSLYFDDTLAGGALEDIPFFITTRGIFNAGTSIVNYFSYTNTKIAETTYYNLSISNDDEIGNTIFLGTGSDQTLTVNNQLSIGGGLIVDADTYDPTIDVNGDFFISGDFQITEFLASGSSVLTLGGNFTNNGTFTHNNGTVSFDTAGVSVISGGNTTFYNFTSTTPNKTIKFQKHTANTPTFVINGLLTLTGTIGNPINIESDTPSSQWLINHQGTENISYANIKDSGCSGTSSEITVTDSTNGDNNGSCWAFSVASPTVSIVDSNGDPVATPNTQLGTTSLGYECQTTNGTLGLSNQRIRITDPGTSNWSVSIAPSEGANALWTDGTNQFDFNDSNNNGCDNGTDGDSKAGQLTINPSTANLAPESGCSSSNISLGNSASYSQGTINSVEIISAQGAQTDCYYELTNIGISQKIPAEQREGNYTLNLTITVVAQ